MRNIALVHLALLLVYCSLEAASQDLVKLSGKVMDSETNEPLAFSTISIKGKAV